MSEDKYPGLSCPEKLYSIDQLYRISWLSFYTLKYIKELCVP